MNLCYGMAMEHPTPPTTFWSHGQSFLIYSDTALWPEIIDSLVRNFAISPFDMVHIGRDEAISVSATREFVSQTRQVPSQGTYRLGVIHHASTATPESANTLLKILEEPPKGTFFLLLTETRDIVPTVASRCAVWYAPFTTTTPSHLLLPLDNTLHFATVSSRLATIVESGQTLEVIDQWTSAVLENAYPNTNKLHWLIEIRAALASTSLNALATLEVTYLFLTQEIRFPHLDQSQTKEDHYGNI